MVAFHPDGRIDEAEHHNPDGSISRSTFVYDDAGRLTESQSRMDEGSASKVVYSYDAAGRHVRTVQVNPDGVEREIEVYTYDDRGRKTELRFLHAPDANRVYGYAVEGTQLYAAPGATTMMVSYAQSGVPDEVLFHDAHQHLVRRVIFERDNRGRLLSEQLQSGEQSPFAELQRQLEDASPEVSARKAAALAHLFGPRQTMSQTSYAYDENGRLRERNTRMGTLGRNRDSFLYDEYSKTIEHTTEHESYKIGIDEHGNQHTVSDHSSRQYSRFEYQYDKQGNWTERVVWTRIEPNPNFERSNIERREITYYSV